MNLWQNTKDKRIKKRGENYWARFSVNGVRIQKYLATKNFSIALQIVEKMSADIVLGRAGVDTGNPLLFKSAWPKFLKDKESGIYTKKGRRRTLKEYSDFGERYFLEFFGHYQISKITVDLFQEYIDWLKENHPGVKRYMNHQKYLSGFLSWASERELIDKKPKLFNPDKRLGEDENEYEPGTLINDEQMRWILTWQPDINEQSFGGRKPRVGEFMLYKKMLAYMGMRSSEVTQLKKDRIDFKKNLIRLKKSDTKTKQARDIPIHPKILDSLGLQFEIYSADYLFPNKDDIDRPMGRDGFQRQWDNMRNHPDAPAGMKKISPHDLRHTYATKIFSDPKLNPMLACKALGMSMATALKHYIHFDESQLHLITERFSVL